MEVPYRDRAAASRWLLAVAAVCSLLAALCILTIDQPVARYLAGYQPLPIWDHILGSLEWAVGLQLIPWTSGIALVLAMVITVAVPKWRHEAPAWMFVASVHILGRIAMVELKDATGRLRPLEWLKKGGDETFLWVKGIAFPSGHVVLFATLIVPAIVLAPRLWPLWGVVAFVAIARIVASAHYISDTLGAVALTCLVTWVLGQVIRPLPPSRRR